MARLAPLGLLLAATTGCQVVSLNRQDAAGGLAEPAAVVAAGAQEPPEPPGKPAEGDSAADHLTRAADCLDRGDDAGAAEHLGRHVAAYPDQFEFRARLADLLARLDRPAEAQAQLEAAAALAQDGPPAARDRLVRYHTRLMEMARARADDYAEHLHRGIGLFLVADRLAAEDAGSRDVERMLCKAAGALKGAQEKRPDDARPAWYLYRVWTRLDQPRPAERALRRAAAAAPFSDLTPAEARELAVAARGER